MSQRNFFSELRRRNVYKVAVAYAVVAWLLIQAASILFPTFEAPGWVMKVVVVVIALGFPIALILAWAFEMTPQGMKRTENVSPNEHIPQWSARKFAALIASLAIVAGGLLLFQFTRWNPEAKTANRAERDGVSDKSIAVLPFENRSRDPDNAYFADGIQDEILTRLAKIADLKVISRTSTHRYKSSPENLPEIAKQLGVEQVLEGSVQKSGEQVRVTVQLIRAATDSHLWAETYDRKLTDIFAVESEVAENIARALQARLTSHEQQAVFSKPTEIPAAYEAYLRGLAHWNKLETTVQDFDAIVADFSRAVELDPKFALGWAFLSIAQSYIYGEFDRIPQKAAQAKEALDHARSLQPDLGEVHFAEGIYRYKVLRDYEKALDAFQIARERSANRSLAVEFSAYVKRRQGKWDDALRLHAESLQLDPRNPIILSEAALTYRGLRRFDEAHGLIDRAREIEPQSTGLLIQKAEVSLAQGDSATAGRLLEAVALDGRDPATVTARVQYWRMMRQYPEAIRALTQMINGQANLAKSHVANYRAELGIEEVLAGNPEEAQAELRDAREELTSIRAQGDAGPWVAVNLVLIAAFLKDRAAVEREAAQLRDEIENDAVSGPTLETAIAVAHAQLGEAEAALKSLKQLLQKPGETSLTPALLRADPLWDPLRNDPRFRELAETKP